MFSGFKGIWRKIVILVHFGDKVKNIRNPCSKTRAQRPITQRRSVRRRSAAAFHENRLKNWVHQKSLSFSGFKCLNRVVHARSTSLMKKTIRKTQDLSAW